MKRRNRRLWSILVACFMVIGVVAAGLPLTANAAEKTTGEPGKVRAPLTYTIHVDYDLLYGKWKPGEQIDPYDVSASYGEHIPPSEFKGENTIPVREGFTFDGWGWEWTDMEGNVLKGGGDAGWIFEDGWRYDDSYPDESKFLFIANWKPVKTPKEEPTKPEAGKVTPKTPKTGDNSPLALATLLLVGAGAATVGVARKSYLNK